MIMGCSFQQDFGMGFLHTIVIVCSEFGREHGDLHLLADYYFSSWKFLISFLQYEKR